MIPPSEACLYGCMSWSLTQGQQQSSISLSQSVLSMRGGKARPRTGFHFNVQKRSMPESSGASLAKRPHLEIGLRLIQLAGSLLVVVSASSADARKKGALGVSIPHVIQSTASASSSSVVQAGMLSHFWDQWRSITSNRFVHNMVQGHHLQLRSHLCSIISSGSILRHLQLIIPLSRRKLMSCLLRDNRTIFWWCWFLCQCVCCF